MYLAGNNKDLFTKNMAPPHKGNFTDPGSAYQVQPAVVGSKSNFGCILVSVVGFIQQVMT